MSDNVITRNGRIMTSGEFDNIFSSNMPMIETVEKLYPLVGRNTYGIYLISKYVEKSGNHNYRLIQCNSVKDMESLDVSCIYGIYIHDKPYRLSKSIIRKDILDIICRIMCVNSNARNSCYEGSSCGPILPDILNTHHLLPPLETRSGHIKKRDLVSVITSVENLYKLICWYPDVYFEQQIIGESSGCDNDKVEHDKPNKIYLSGSYVNARVEYDKLDKINLKDLSRVYINGEAYILSEKIVNKISTYVIRDMIDLNKDIFKIRKEMSDSHTHKDDTGISTSEYIGKILLSGKRVEYVKFEYDDTGDMTESSNIELFERLSKAETIIFSLDNTYSKSAIVHEARSVDELVSVSNKDNNDIHLYGTIHKDIVYVHELLRISNDVDIRALESYAKHANEYREILESAWIDDDVDNVED